MSANQLNGEQMRMLGELVEIKSVDDAGQVEILEYIERQLQNCGCRISRMEIGDGTFNLIVEKGEGPKTLYLTGHVDTVDQNNNGEPKCALSRDGNKMFGLGVWDMKAGIMAIMDVMRRVDPPPGMKVAAVFLVDEEKNSKGALRAVGDTRYSPLGFKIGEILSPPDLAFSPEIPTNAIPLPPGHGAIVIARAGRVKLHGHLHVGGGHGARMLKDIEDRYFNLKEYVKGRVQKLLNQRIDPYGLYDALRLRRPMEYGSNGHFFSHPQYADFYWGHSSALQTANTILDFYQKRFDEWNMKTFGKKGCCDPEFIPGQENPGFGASIEIERGLTSYDPYRMDEDSKYIGPIRRLVRETQYVEPELVAGASTADGCVFTKHGWNSFIEVSPRGSGAHAPHEQTSEKSVAKIIRMIEELVKGRVFD